MVAPAAKSDPFLQRLLMISERVYGPGGRNLKQDNRLCITRSDYLVGVDGPRQVEMNLIACSLHHLSGKVVELHKSNMQRLTLSSYGCCQDGCCPDTCKCLSPDNHQTTDGQQTLQRHLQAAHEMYRPAPGNLTGILAVGDLSGTNHIDQTSNLPADLSLYLSPSQLKETFLRGDLFLQEDRLILKRHNCCCCTDHHHNFEVSVVYFRSGYAEDADTDTTWWDIRETIERSRAFKCPSVPQQLTGSKSVQSLLAQDDILRALGMVGEIAIVTQSDDAVHRIMAVTALQADPTLNSSIVEKALAFPENFVLKPCKEGGGNNLFGEDIPPMLVEILKNSSEGSDWVLMERVEASAETTVLVEIRAGQPLYYGQPVQNEIGMYGCVLV
ncbi:MAG: hypothetical protein KVP17_002383 [Porospora cf. gigantea B]|nr:MAG: hypothetical protein KVP17_002383 [Porospora cf. gigantea B]